MKRRTIPAGDFEREVLIVASKLKKYVKDRHDLNTSGNVMERLSDLVRGLVDDAVIRARQEGAKNVDGPGFLAKKSTLLGCFYY